jgi:hypothetical protein
MEDGMSLEAHLEGLSKKHRSLHKQIESALAHSSFDELKLAEMKREKLRLKDEIERLKSRTH